MADRWEELSIIANGAATRHSDEPEFVSHLPNPHMKLGRPEEAWSALASAAARFSDDELFAYQLACCLGVLGRLSEARDWRAKAFQLSEDPAALKLRALNDTAEFAKMWTENQSLK
jgi:hypothetical protein